MRRIQHMRRISPLTKLNVFSTYRGAVRMYRHSLSTCSFPQYNKSHGLVVPMCMYSLQTILAVPRMRTFITPCIRYTPMFLPYWTFRGRVALMRFSVRVGCLALLRVPPPLSTRIYRAYSYGAFACLVQ